MMSLIEGMNPETPYEATLTSELSALRKVLLHHHQLEVRALQNANQRMQSELQKFESTDFLEPFNADCSQSLGLGGLDDEPVLPLQKWGEFTERLLQGVPDTIEEPMETNLREELRMRNVWKVSFQDVRHRGTAIFRPLKSAVTSDDLRMNEALLEDSCWQRFVVEPRSTKQMCWSTFGSILILWDLITIPLGIFDLPQFVQTLSILARASFVYWLLDMPLHFFFGVEVAGTMELRPRALARKYFKSWFFIDLLVILIDAGIIVVEVFGEVGMELAPFRSARFLRALRLLRLLRLLRVAKLQQEMMILANRFLSTHTFMLMKVVAGIFMMLLINHIIACSWYGIGTWEFEGKSWLQKLEIDKANFADSYACAMHWALTQFTPATNNIAPDNVLERIFALVIILLAIGVFSSFLASISSTMNSLRSARMEQSQKRAKLLQFFTERGLSVSLYGQIQQALQREGHFEVRLKEPDVALIQKIPDRLKMQLHEEMFLSSLHCLKIWPSDAPQHEYFFSTLCHNAMQEHSVTPGQDAFMQGTECKHVYIIEAGCMGYIPPMFHFTSEAIPIHPQKAMCMPCLWAEWTTRGRLTASMGICYYVKLNCEQFGAVVRNMGGSLYQYLQIFGILLVGEVEAMDEEGMQASDVCLPQETLQAFGQRAERFADLLKMSGDSPFETVSRGTTRSHNSSPGKMMTSPGSSSDTELISERM